MSIMLPTELAHFLQRLGFDWPEGDEDKVFGYAQKWSGFAGTLTSVSTPGNDAARAVMSDNEGPGVEAFKQRFSAQNGPEDTAQSIAMGANLCAGAITLMAGAIIALKVVVVAQLVQFAITFASAVAAAVPSCGASLSLIPIAELIAQKAITFAINYGIEQLLAGG
jgi:hypothetical protein